MRIAGSSFCAVPHPVAPMASSDRRSQAVTAYPIGMQEPPDLTGAFERNAAPRSRRPLPCAGWMSSRDDRSSRRPPRTRLPSDEAVEASSQTFRNETAPFRYLAYHVDTTNVTDPYPYFAGGPGRALHLSTPRRLIPFRSGFWSVDDWPH